MKTKHWSQISKFECSDLLKASLHYLAWSFKCDLSTKHALSPFDNTSESYKNQIFEAISYDWHEDYESGIIQPYNFKWRDFEVKWYKYLGRGMECNRKISNDEIAIMLNECLESLAPS